MVCGIFGWAVRGGGWMMCGEKEGRSVSYPPLKEKTPAANNFNFPFTFSLLACSVPSVCCCCCCCCCYCGGDGGGGGIRILELEFKSSQLSLIFPEPYSHNLIKSQVPLMNDAHLSKEAKGGKSNRFARLFTNLPNHI